MSTEDPARPVDPELRDSSSRAMPPARRSRLPDTSAAPHRPRGRHHFWWTTSPAPSRRAHATAQRVRRRSRDLDQRHRRVQAGLGYPSRLRRPASARLKRDGVSAQRNFGVETGAMSGRLGATRIVWQSTSAARPPGSGAGRASRRPASRAARRVLGEWLTQCADRFRTDAPAAPSTGAHATETCGATCRAGRRQPVHLPGRCITAQVPLGLPQRILVEDDHPVALRKRGDGTEPGWSGRNAPARSRGRQRVVEGGVAQLT